MLMDQFQLAGLMKRLNVHMDARCRADGLKQHRFDAAPFGSAYVTISLAEQGPYASSNFNRVHLCGAEEGLTADGMARIADLFSQAGVERYFVWLSPGPRMEVVRGWLIDAGMTRRLHVSYPTLVRGASILPGTTRALEAREMGAGEATLLAERHEGIAWPDYLRSAGALGFHHFVAFDGGRPIATAVLCVFDGLGYLGAALTAEAFRGRGAQRALIAKRIETAAALGCQILVCETLSMLEVSLGNLQKAGFRVMFEKDVYEAKLPT
jgi:GNAT superfamily N-acetyltransferase